MESSSAAPPLRRRWPRSAASHAYVLPPARQRAAEAAPVLRLHAERLHRPDRQRAARMSGERRLVVAIAVLALIGAGVAGYLTYVHCAHTSVLCVSGGASCEKVQSSSYAKLAGVPVALLGLIGYIALLASLAVRGEAGRFAGAFIALAGFGFSLYLTYRELFTIKAICQWCVASAVVMTALAALTTARLLLAEQKAFGTFEPRIRSRG